MFVVPKTIVKLIECVSSTPADCSAVSSEQSLDALQGDLLQLKKMSGFLEVTYSIGTCHFEGVK